MSTSRKEQFQLVAVLAGGTMLILIAALVGFWQQPRRVVERSFHKLALARTQQFSVEIKQDNSEAAKALLREAGSVRLLLRGAYDRGVEPAALMADVQLTSQTASVTIQVEGELRFVGTKVYLFIRKAPATTSVLHQLRGRWVSLPRGGKLTSTPASPSGPLFSQVRRRGLRQYQVIATDTAVVNMMNSIARVLGTQLTEQQLQSVRQNASQLREVPVQVTVTPWANELRQLEGLLKVPQGHPVYVAWHFSNRNKPVSIAVPEGAVLVEEILKASPQ